MSYVYTQRPVISLGQEGPVNRLGSSILDDVPTSTWFIGALGILLILVLVSPVITKAKKATGLPDWL